MIWLDPCPAGKSSCPGWPDGTFPPLFWALCYTLVKNPAFTSEKILTLLVVSKWQVRYIIFNKSFRIDGNLHVKLSYSITQILNCLQFKLCSCVLQNLGLCKFLLTQSPNGLLNSPLIKSSVRHRLAIVLAIMLAIVLAIVLGSQF